MSRTKSWRSSRYLRGIQDTLEGEINLKLGNPKRVGNNHQNKNLTAEKLSRPSKNVKHIKTLIEDEQFDD